MPNRAVRVVGVVHALGRIGDERDRVREVVGGVHRAARSAELGEGIAHKRCVGGEWRKAGEQPAETALIVEGRTRCHVLAGDGAVWHARLLFWRRGSDAHAGGYDDPVRGGCYLNMGTGRPVDLAAGFVLGWAAAAAARVDPHIDGTPRAAAGLLRCCQWKRFDCATVAQSSGPARAFAVARGEGMGNLCSGRRARIAVAGTARSWAWAGRSLMLTIAGMWLWPLRAGLPPGRRTLRLSRR
jgi:hypothetical protein